MRAKDLAYEFERMGPLVRCDIPALKSASSTPYAFIEYEDPRDADAAFRDMHGMSFGRHQISIQFAKNAPSANWRFDGPSRAAPPRLLTVDAVVVTVTIALRTTSHPHRFALSSPRRRKRRLTVQLRSVLASALPFVANVRLNLAETMMQTTRKTAGEALVVMTMLTERSVATTETAHPLSATVTARTLRMLRPRTVPPSRVLTMPRPTLLWRKSRLRRPMPLTNG